MVWRRGHDVLDGCGEAQAQRVTMRPNHPSAQVDSRFTVAREIPAAKSSRGFVTMFRIGSALNVTEGRHELESDLGAIWTDGNSVD